MTLWPDYWPDEKENMNTKFTIIVASYNYRRYIGQTLNSILAQTYKDFEVLVVDDCSQDDSVSLIKEYCQKDARVRLIENDKNLGLVRTLKKAVSLAQNPWLAFCESDDYWTPDYLAEKAAYIKAHPETAIVVNDVALFGDDKAMAKVKKERVSFEKLKKYQDPRSMYADLFYHNIIPTFSCAVVRKDLLEACDFNPVQPALLDWWLWRQLAPDYKVGYIDKKLTFWRMHDNSYIRRHQEKGKELSRQMFYANNRLIAGKGRLKFYLTWMKAFVLKHFVRVKVTKNNRLLIRVCALPICNIKLKNQEKD